MSLDATYSHINRITNCFDCPHKASIDNHGEYFYYCSHPESPKGYSSVICGGHVKKIEKNPDWCPLKITYNNTEDDKFKRPPSKMMESQNAIGEAERASS
jgi:hypothetical protein